MLTFNELIRQSFVQIDWRTYKYCEFAIEIIKFIEEALILISKKTNGFKLSLKPFQTEWLEHIQELIQITLSMCSQVVDYETYPLFAKEVLISLLKSMEILKQLFVIN